jgi:hypothetical protein
MLKSLLIIITAGLLVFSINGTALAQGEAGAACLIIQPGARANGMGQSYVAISDDATGGWWNPAGLAFTTQNIDLMHSQLVPELASDVFYEFIGGTFELEGIGVLGASIIYLTYGEWEGRDADNN